MNRRNFLGAAGAFILAPTLLSGAACDIGSESPLQNLVHLVESQGAAYSGTASTSYGEMDFSGHELGFAMDGDRYVPTDLDSASVVVRYEPGGVLSFDFRDDSQSIVFFTPDMDLLYARHVPYTADRRGLEQRADFFMQSLI